MKTELSTLIDYGNRCKRNVNLYLKLLKVEQVKMKVIEVTADRPYIISPSDVLITNMYEFNPFIICPLPNFVTFISDSDLDKDVYVVISPR